MRYTITQEDVDNGGTSNTVTVEGEGSGEKDPEPEEPEEPILTDDKKPAAITTKTLTNAGTGENGSFKAGETAEFDITVENTGNVTLKDVVVTEQLDGAEIVEGEGYTVNENGTATITAIKVGEIATVKAVYTVTQEDVDNGGVRNIAAVEIPDVTDPQAPTEEIPTETQNPEFTSTKELTNEGTGEEGTFKVGEEATFDITVRNSGNVTLNDVVVTEQLDGARILAGDGYRVRLNGTAIIDTLEVGNEVVVKAAYTITQEDVDNGGTVNIATAEGEGPEGTDPEPVDPEVPIPTEDPNPSMSVQKTVISANEVYRVGDTITYQIVVVNDGNTTLHDVVVTDTLQNAAGEVTFERTAGVTFDGSTATIDTMAPGQTVTLNCSYEVTRADAGNEIINTAIGDSEETDPTDPSTTDPTDAEDLYNLTINYVYATGGTAAPSVNAQYLEGETFGYTSPIISGYTADYAFVRTGAEGMPARDVVITVVYTANPVVVPTPTPTPGGDTTPAPTPGGDAAPTPAPGGDAAPGVPAVAPTPTVTPAAPVPAPGDGTTGGEITTDDNGEVEVVPVVDEEVPLANRDLDDHECCVLHFLLMLIAMIVYAAYTRSMKKRQERIAELAEELETEMLKRKQQE